MTDLYRLLATTAIVGAAGAVSLLAHWYAVARVAPEWLAPAALAVQIVVTAAAVAWYARPEDPTP